MLDLSVVSDVMSFNFSSNSTTNEVNLNCIVSETKQRCDQASILEKYQSYEFSFVPTTNGTYVIKS